MTQSFVGKVLRHAGSIRSGVLSVAGFGLLTSAAFTFGTWPGLVAAGVSCLLIDYTRDKSTPDPAPEVEAQPQAAPR